MTAPLDAVTDPARLDALDRYAVLDTEPEKGFDDIVLLARMLCAAPVALVSLVAQDRQWFKARSGFELCETALNASVCAHALGRDDLLVIPDLTQDPRTCDNPLVIGDPYLRFYAGAPLHTPEGATLGSLCVIDKVPRPDGLTRDQAEGLTALAGQVLAQLELRRAVAERDEALLRRHTDEQRHRQILDSASDYAIITTDLDGLITTWNMGAERILGWSEAELLGQRADVFFPPEDRAAGRASCLVPGSRDVILTREAEEALWQTVFTAAPERRREFEPSSRRRKRRPAPWPSATA